MTRTYGLPGGVFTRCESCGWYVRNGSGPYCRTCTPSHANTEES